MSQRIHIVADYDWTRKVERFADAHGIDRSSAIRLLTSMAIDWLTPATPPVQIIQQAAPKWPGLGSNQ